MNPRRRRRLRHRRRLCAWVETWAHKAPENWTEAWREYVITGWPFLLDFDTANRAPGWRRWGAQAGLAAFRRGAKP